MRFAILDLGTNTFHLYIADVTRERGIRKLFKSKKVVKLGDGMQESGAITPASFRRGLEALKHYREIISQYEPGRIIAFGTSALRSASNAEEFIRAVKKETGIAVRIISGDEEAELIWHGVRSCIPMGEEPSLIMDIGGGSTEFIIANQYEIFWKRSFNIGASRMVQQFRPSDKIRSTEIKAFREFLHSELEPLRNAAAAYPFRTMIGSSGSFDTFASMVGYAFHNRDVLKGVKSYEFNLDEFRDVYEMLLRSTREERLEIKGLVKMRVDLIVLAGISTMYVIDTFSPERMLLSKYALKEGALELEISN